ncbi:MAG: hypothetical protein ABI742_03175 [Gemmatimonadota bacterium]
MLTRWIPVVLLGATLNAGAATAQSDSAAVPQRIAPEGVFRASALVDSVFVERQLSQARVDGGDFAAYLLARLGARNLPPDFAFTVEIDSALIRIAGRIADLPAEARQALSQLVLLLPPDTKLEARIELAAAGREAVRFHLLTIAVQGVPIPETFLAPLLADIGRQYPALTASGRDLYVQVPSGAKLTLVPGAVLLTGP